MKTQKNILVAFLLNFSFSVLEYFGGLFTGSIAIISDSVHDFGDALSIGLSYFLERKSKKGPDEKYSYGYVRWSVMGGLITVCILTVGSVLVLVRAVGRLLHPEPVDYGGMLIFAVVGVVLNFLAAWFTREGDSINQKAVNLHMLEDVLGWAVVLLGSVIMKFTGLVWIDPLMSIGVSLFILVESLKSLRDLADLFLEKVPRGMSPEEIKAHLREIKGVLDVHHVHLWSMNGYDCFATMHIVAEGEAEEIKRQVREELREHGIAHVTLELEKPGELCGERECRTVESAELSVGHHHHH